MPSTDTVLNDPRLANALRRLGRGTVRDAVHRAQEAMRQGTVDPGAVVDAVLASLPDLATSMRPVINATGVVLHTNLGRAPLSPAARDAVAAAAAYVDVEFDLESGERARRGRGALAALRSALPEAGDVLVVNNGAAALLLAATALAQGREVVWSRGEMVEIGDGFRLPELVESCGARIREVGTTNRTTLADYRAAIGPETGAILKVHPSNFRVTGFTDDVSVRELATLDPPLIVDTGSGLLHPDPLLAGEMDLAGALRDGADVVTSSGDKLLGGPQAGIIAGSDEVIARLRRHPMARALRVDKLTLAALEATLSGPRPPLAAMLHADPDALRRRCAAVAGRVGGSAEVVACDGAVGGGSAPGVALAGWAVSLPERLAPLLRCGDPPIVGRIERGRCLLDLRCVDPSDDGVVVEAVLRCM